MKKNYFVILFIFLMTSLYATDIFNESRIKFVKGNVLDKIQIIKESDKTNAAKLSPYALNFVIENINLLNNDRDLAGLAIVSILAYPESEYIKEPEEIINKLESIYYNFSDENVKITILDKIYSLYKIKPSENSAKFINNYLIESHKDNIQPSEVEKKAIQIISEISNESSFEILYNIYDSNSWNNINSVLKNALVTLATNSPNKINELIQNANIEKLQKIYTLFLDSDKNILNIKPEIAENFLRRSMIIIKESSMISKEISDFQLNICKILFENNWTRSAELMVSYFEIAKNEFNSGFLTEQDFSNVIKYVERLASKKSVKIFISYLEDLNGQMTKGSLSSETVVSALIQALGSLGDKSAFDCLLYTTYLNYSEEVIAQARSALSSLKW